MVFDVAKRMALEAVAKVAMLDPVLNDMAIEAPKARKPAAKVMASTSAVNLDTLVTLKIHIEGRYRRFKFPLRDLGPSTLPERLRFHLAIPPTSEAVFERYSDSAAAFIVLDPSNASVYKQLYRAAKAKLKLRIKVTLKDKELVAPKPTAPEARINSHRETLIPETTMIVPRGDMIVERRGIKILVNNRNHSAFGDTGAGQNVISERQRQKWGLEMRYSPTSFPMGNSRRIYSPGTVEFPLAFEDDPTSIITVVAHVVHKFAYDFLLGNPFLRATDCLTKFSHRFVRCLFSVKSLWSFNLLGETIHRFRGQMGKAVPFLALPDIGSVRNVMDARWAVNKGKAAGFDILTGPENRGWILFPDGSEEATVGQAHTMITLPDGKVESILFELLPNCHVPVVLGQDFIFDHDIFTRYAASIVELNDLNRGDELMPMNFRESGSKARKSKANLTPVGTRQKDDLERHVDWDLKYQYGRKASVDEWNLEYARRERYERSRNSNWQPDPSIPLIEQMPQSSETRPALTQPPLLLARNVLPEEGSDTIRSFQSWEPTITNSAASSNPAMARDSSFSDALVSEEVAQWQAERPL